MGKFQVVDGDFKPESTGGVTKGEIKIIDKSGKLETYDKIEKIQEISSEKKTRWARRAGWTVGVTALTGGLGLVPAYLLAGRDKTIFFEAVFPDNRSFLGIADKKSYGELSKLTKNTDEPPQPEILATLIKKP